MQTARLASVAIMLAATGLSGCADKGLRTLTHNGNGPDEFLVTPTEPLAQPTDYSFLPAPTPGGANRVDAQPRAEAVKAVGGGTASLDPNGPIPGADGALVTAASRNGVEPDVRQTLAEADAQFRKRQSRLSSIKLFRVDRYAQAYRREAIDPFAVNEGFRRAGVPTPAAPPWDE